MEGLKYEVDQIDQQQSMQPALTFLFAITNMVFTKVGQMEMMGHQEETWKQSSYSEKLLKNREMLITAFKRIVRETIQAAKNVDDETLENSLFDFLTNVAEILSGEWPKGEGFYKRNIEIAREHGRSRSMISQYTLDQVISEFRILRSLMFTLLEEEGPLPTAERDGILFSIDNGVIQAASEFAINRGFKDARLAEEISAKTTAQDEAKGLKEEKQKREKAFSIVTHDIRNPLSVIKASAELIIGRPSDPNQVRKFALKILNNVERSNRMIKDLLDSNTLQWGGSLTLKKEDCDLKAIIKDICDDFSEVHGVRFKFVASGEVHGKYDGSGLRRAIENLLVNALKYGLQDRPIIITLISDDAENRIQVHNEGNPIPFEEQKSLFQQYYRSQNARQGTQQGWGIGLTLVKGIAEAHGGRVEVESSKEKGTTFSIILPRYPSL